MEFFFVPVTVNKCTKTCLMENDTCIYINMLFSPTEVMLFHVKYGCLAIFSLVIESMEYGCLVMFSLVIESME